MNSLLVSIYKYQPLIYNQCKLYFNPVRHSSVKPAAANVGALMGLGKGKKKGKAGAGVVEKVLQPVETDTVKLVNYVCGSNINVTGEDIKIKPNSEYPDWLWSLHVGKPPTLDQLDPTTKAYWTKVRTIGMKRNNMLKKMKKF